MQILKVEVSNYENGKHQFRVFARNDKGMVVIGLSSPFTIGQAPGLLEGLVKELERTQANVPHVSPLGQE